MRLIHSLAGAGRRVAVLAFLAAAVGLLLFTLDFAISRNDVNLDFVSMYAAGTMLRDGLGARLYDLPVQQSIEARLAPDAQFLPFDHPAFEAWLCLPLALFSFREAYLLWTAFNLLVLGTVFYFLPRTGYRLSPDSRLVWLAASLPVSAGSLVLGQDTLLLAPIFLFAFLALKKRRDLIAGLLLGIGLYRFEILLPFAFIFLLRRRWKVLAGFGFAAALAFLVSLALVGWHGLLAYIKVIVGVAVPAVRAANGISPAEATPSLGGALAAFSNGAIPPGWIFPLTLVGTLMLLGWAAWEFRDIGEPQKPGFDIQFSFAVVAALLGSYHIFAHELTPLIIVAFLILHHEDVADRARPVLTRPGAALLLLFFLVMAVSATVGFRQFSVLFVVLLGLMAWLSQETAASRNLPCPH